MVTIGDSFCLPIHQTAVAARINSEPHIGNMAEVVDTLGRSVVLVHAPRDYWFLFKIIDLVPSRRAWA